MSSSVPDTYSPPTASRSRPTALAATKPLLPYMAAGVTVVFWASAFPGIRASLPAYSPAHVALLRYAVASGLLAIYALATRLPLPHWRDVPAFLGLGIIGISIYNVALNTGELTVPSGLASFIVASAPIFMALQASQFLGERLQPWGWLGIGISFSGVALISLHMGHGWVIDWHVLLVLAAAIGQSIYSIGQKSLLRRYSPLACTTYAIWAGTFFLLIFAPGLGREMQVAPVGATLAVIYLGIFPGALAYVAWSHALAHLPATQAASFLYIVPVIALGIAWVWLGEMPTLIAVLGGALVIVGVITVNTRGRAPTVPQHAGAEGQISQ